MRKSIWLTTLAAGLGVFALGISSAFAEPSVAFPAGNAAWMVDFTPIGALSGTSTPPTPGKRARAQSQTKKVEVVQSGEMRRVRITSVDGQTRERWTVPNLPVIFKEYPGGTVGAAENAGKEAVTDSFNVPVDNAAFDWVTPACLKENVPVAYRGQQCYHYEGIATGVTQQSEKRDAWIDIKTLYPVALETPSALCVFTFLAPPTAPLQMSQKFKEEVDYYKHVMGYH